MKFYDIRWCSQPVRETRPLDAAQVGFVSVIVVSGLLALRLVVVVL